MRNKRDLEDRIGATFARRLELLQRLLLRMRDGASHCCVRVRRYTIGLLEEIDSAVSEGEGRCNTLTGVPGEWA